MDERGVEPLAMKLFAGIVLLVIGLGIAYGVYGWASKGARQLLSFSVSIEGQTSYSLVVGIPDSGENEVNLEVSVEEIGDYDQTVTLSASGTPSGVSVGFSPASGDPPFGSTLIIRVDNTALSGPTTITIKATGADGTESFAKLQLTLE